MSEPCPLCGGIATAFHEDRRRPYLRCPACALVFVPPAFHLDAAAERLEYDRHRNFPDDAGYRRFLGRAFDAVMARVRPPANGLDFGCGPGPVLAAMLREAGHVMRVHDPFYADHPEHLDRRHDFITATEVFEHLRDPATTLARLVDGLEPGGWLVVMTKRPRDRDAFARWHYIHDPTHIAFFAEETFAWIAARYRLHLEIVGPDVVALRK